MNLAIKNIFKVFTGFSLVGVLSTLITMCTLFIFLEYLRTPLIMTYMLIYFASILFSYFLNSRYVFKAKQSYKQGIGYFVIYLSGMLLGAGVLWILKNTLPYDHYILSYLVIPVTMAWNFILSYYLFKKEEKC